MTKPSITPSPTQLKALTHPGRVRMLGLLRVDGPATATTLATRLGLNTGATSYHLRQLARHGFIEDDEERGTGRERWWRAAHASTLTGPPSDDRRAGEALDAYLQSIVGVYAQQLQRAMEERPLLPAAWRDASTFSDWTVRLTPARAKDVVEQLAELLRQVRDQDDDDDAEQFVVQFNAYPFPGHVGGGRP